MFMVLILGFFCLTSFQSEYAFIDSRSETNSDSLYVRAIDFYEESEDSSTTIEITYPRIFGIKDNTVQEKLNAFLEEEFLRSIDWYEEFISIQDSFPSIEYESGMFFSFETGFEIKLMNDKYLSLVLNHYEFTGGAHGNFYAIGYSLNLDTGELITLEKLFDSDALLKITELCTVKILEMFEAESLSDAGLFEDYLELTPDQDFYLLPDALVLQFDPYEIAPYSMGNIDVVIPIENIKDFLLIDPFYGNSDQ